MLTVTGELFDVAISCLLAGLSPAIFALALSLLCSVCICEIAPERCLSYVRLHSMLTRAKIGLEF